MRDECASGVNNEMRNWVHVWLLGAPTSQRVGLVEWAIVREDGRRRRISMEKREIRSRSE